MELQNTEFRKNDKDAGKVANTETTISESAERFEKFSRTTFENPVAFFVMQLISTKTALDVDSIVRKFPSDAQLDGYIRKVVNELEGAGFISVEKNGDIQTKDSWVTITKHIPECLSVYPTYVEAAMKRILKDVAEDKSVKNHSTARILNVADTPAVRARIRRLEALIDQEIKEIKKENQNNSQCGVRTIVFMTTTPKAEDFV